MHIQRIELQSNLIAKLEDFYTGLLGFPLLEKEEQSFFSCQIGKSVLAFRETIQTESCYHFAFNIAHNQLDSAREWLINKGIKLCQFEGKEVIDFPNWNAHALYFTDLAGNVVEFIARHDLENAIEEAFSTHQILEISEIGLPVPNIKEAYEQLKTSLDIPIYSQISNLKSFCAAGDAEGLFILVPLNRVWFPTEIMNGIYPTKVWLEGVDKQEVVLENLPYEIYTTEASE